MRCPYKEFVYRGKSPHVQILWSLPPLCTTSTLSIFTEQQMMPHHVPENLGQIARTSQEGNCDEPPKTKKKNKKKQKTKTKKKTKKNKKRATKKKKKGQRIYKTITNEVFGKRSISWHLFMSLIGKIFLYFVEINISAHLYWSMANQGQPLKVVLNDYIRQKSVSVKFMI